MKTLWNKKALFSKKALGAFAAVGVLAVAACSVNPATGDRQFTALLPADKEAAIGAQEHQKVAQQFGSFMRGPIEDYVASVGARVAANTERADIQYKFHVIDSPIVNAFAIPGGYVYVSRGLLALANNEAELAGVLAHEVGHITARHAAERMSQGFLVGLGAAVLSAATNTAGVSQAASLGSELYIKSYSRGQEHESDSLGVRYLARAGYDTTAMASFLNSLDQQTKLDAQLAGKKTGAGANYFSTHPVTAERVVKASAEAKKFPTSDGRINRESYLKKISGMTYGDSAEQGFVRGNNFYHTKMGFTFSVPEGNKIQNSQAAVASQHPNGTVIIFDQGRVKDPITPLSYLQNIWLKDKQIGNAESITINGMRAATAAFSGNVQGKAANIRLVAIEWEPGTYFRFQMAIPKNVTSAFMDELKATTYSFRRLSGSEKNRIQPQRIRLVTARGGDTQASLSAQMDVEQLKQEQFRVLNGLRAGESIIAGRQYKVIDG